MMDSDQSDQYLNATFDTIENTIYKSGPPPPYVSVRQAFIERTIANPPDDETVHRFICDDLDFTKLESLLEKYPTSGVYLDPRLKNLKFVTVPSNVHQDAAVWFVEWGIALKTGIPLPNLQATTAPRLGNFVGQYAGRKKEPDAVLFANRNDTTPTVAVEVGYSETLADLRHDARLLLEGSQGVIGLVILIKIIPAGPQDTSIQHGHLEVWQYDHGRNKAVYKHRRQLFPAPPPSSREFQEIKIPWSIILRGHQPYPSQDPPPLSMAVLRDMLDPARGRDLRNIN